MTDRYHKPAPDGNTWQRLGDVVKRIVEALGGK